METSGWLACFQVFGFAARIKNPGLGRLGLAFGDGVGRRNLAEQNRCHDNWLAIPFCLDSVVLKWLWVSSRLAGLLGWKLIPHNPFGGGSISRLAFTVMNMLDINSAPGAGSLIRGPHHHFGTSAPESLPTAPYQMLGIVMGSDACVPRDVVTLSGSGWG
ncbi:hypothetical protein VTK26DRAFT_6386 [Humicola hyalothermophila]